MEVYQGSGEMKRIIILVLVIIGAMIGLCKDYMRGLLRRKNFIIK